MIIERPGADNDRDHVISNIDNDRFNGIDRDKFGDSYENIFGKFIPQYERNCQNVDKD